MEPKSDLTVEGVYDAAFSASAQNETVVSAVRDVLNRKGFRVFDWTKDSSELLGQSIPAAIEQLLANQVGSIVVFLSHAYSESAWCRRELDFIRRLRNDSDAPSILPVRLDATEVPEAFRDVVWLDATRLDPKGVGDALAGAIRSNLTANRRIEQALDDDSLARKAITERDPEAFALLAQRLVPLGYSVARRYGVSSADADDIVQEALAMLFTRSYQFDASLGSIRRYFTMLVRNTVVHTFRRKAKRRETQSSEWKGLATHESTSQIDEEETLSQVTEALKSLSETDRRVITLLLLEDRSTSEAASLLGISANSLHRRFHHALATLRLTIAEGERPHGA